MGRVHRYPHTIPRYGPALRLVRAAPRGSTIVEVGSSDEGIGTWYHDPYVGMDLSFRGPRPTNMAAVIGDAMRLPLADHSADVVLCIAMLPHLVGGAVEAVLPELTRITRRSLMIITPSGPEAEHSDRRMLAWGEKHGFGRPEWIEMQVERGLPSPEMLRAALEPFGTVTEGTTVSVPWQERFYKLERWMERLRGTRTAAQPLLRNWPAGNRRALDGNGPPYERWFRLDVRAD